MHANTAFVLSFVSLSFGCPVVSATQSFAGTNNYFLHGLPPSEQEAYLSVLSSWGAKVVRLWVTGTTAGCVKGSTDETSIPQLENTVGTYDTTVLDKLDDTLALLSKYGMKAIISPHDANQVNGSNGCDAYCHKYGNQATFYSSSDAKQDYDNRLSTIMKYQSPNFGKAWASLNEVIWAFDLQNEPFSSSSVFYKLDDNDLDDWLCGRAGVLRNSLALSSEITVATGGIGGSEVCCNREYNLLDKALYCDAIDIMSVHGYMSKVSVEKSGHDSPLA